MKKIFLSIVLMTLALVSFEVFNFQVTQNALSDLLKPLGQAGVSWALVLTIALCAIDVLALVWISSAMDKKRDFTLWFLFWAWFLGVFFNAMVLGWGFYLALQNHSATQAIATVLAVILAIVVSAIRVLVVNSPIIFLNSHQSS